MHKCNTSIKTHTLGERKGKRKNINIGQKKRPD